MSNRNKEVSISTQCILFVLIFLLSISCSANRPAGVEEVSSSKRPELGLRQQYNDALLKYYASGQADEQLHSIIGSQRGTKYASYANLILGDTNFNTNTSSSLRAAATYYNIFLESNSISPLVPYALSQLVIIDFLLNESKIFVKHTDLASYKNVISNYNKFYFLYPNSVYFEIVQDILAQTIQKLALIEHSIGDWYLRKELYPAAASRYQEILREYPAYENSDEILANLLVALRRASQNQQADEIEKSQSAIQSQ